MYNWTTSATYALPQQGPTPDRELDKIIDEACLSFGVERHMLYKKCKKEDIKYTRWAVYKILNSRKYSLNQMAQVFGQDRGSVRAALLKIDNDIKNIGYVGHAFKKLTHFLTNKI